MKIEFNGDSYTIGNRTGWSACIGCVITENKPNLRCPVNSEGECILPLTKVYTDCNYPQVFKL